MWNRTLPFIEIYGTRGTLSLPDPDTFDGDVRLRLHRDDDWRVAPPVIPPLAAAGSRDQYLRGIGVADLAAALHGGAHRANATLAYHVLETLTAIQTASDMRTAVRIESACDRPAPLTAGELAAWTGGATP